METPRKSFFLFAGAGSGKTRSLVNAAKALRAHSGDNFRIHQQRLGIITYTNAACDEIKSRLEFDPLVEVSTIHSFVWSLIKGFHLDIKKWLNENLKTEVAELEEKQQKGRPGTKAAKIREEAIEAKKNRIATLDGIKRFTYSPNGDNRGKDSLNHSEVIKIGADFLSTKSLMQKIFTNKFPVLLIDESQDTNKFLMESFLEVQRAHPKHFALGLLGDTMQRIYGDGKPDLGQDLPDDWAKPIKQMNHRCPLRIIKLINKVRADVDGQSQKHRSDKEKGVVRLFIFDSSATNKPECENRAAKRMAEVTGDPLWDGAETERKTLIIEHHMAARRMGFHLMFEPLYKIDNLRTGLLDGTIPGLRIFSELALPLLKAMRRDDNFSVSAIVRKHSPLLRKKTLLEHSENQKGQIKSAKDATNKLLELWNADENPTFLEVLRNIAETGLFEIPDTLLPFASPSEPQREEPDPDHVEDSLEEDVDPGLEAWEAFLATPFLQIEFYQNYVTGRATFETHQGVKGLEYPRVMVVIDNSETRGFLFNYEKFIGAESLTSTDTKNESEGKETSNDRTRRLFYVTCSRAQKSLAIVVYTANPGKVREHVISKDWFESNEIEELEAIQERLV